MTEPGILLIEDNEEDAAMVTRILRKYHIANRVESARDGVEALRLLRSGSPERFVPELVLLDYSQPSIPALEAAIRLRSLPGLDRVPIILCCGTAEEESQVKQWGMRRVAWMSKPAGFFKLLEGIQKLEMHWQVFASKPGEA